jgi:hypothetical protein
MARLTDVAVSHSPAWVVQVWISFIVAVAATSLGIFYLPVDGWVRGFLAMGLLFSVGSSVSLSKTLRDLHESHALTKRIDEARVNRLIAEHDPLAPPM